MKRDAYDLQDCYRILELDSNATMESVKQSYRVLVKVWHPDRFGTDQKLQQKAQEKLKQINLAYELICKINAPTPNRGAAPDQPPSSSAGSRDNSPGYQTRSQNSRTGQTSPPKPEPNSTESGRKESTHRQGKEAKWTHAAIGFGFLVMSLWLSPMIWDDFLKYEAGEGLRTTRNAFLLYQLLGKQGVVAVILLFGLFMGYFGFCHVRALLSKRSLVFFTLEKKYMIAACVFLGFLVIIGERPSSHPNHNSAANMPFIPDDVSTAHDTGIRAVNQSVFTPPPIPQKSTPNQVLTLEQKDELVRMHGKDPKEWTLSADNKYLIPKTNSLPNLTTEQKDEAIRRLGKDPKEWTLSSDYQFLLPKPK